MINHEFLIPDISMTGAMSNVSKFNEEIDLCTLMCLQNLFLSSRGIARL